MDVKRGIVARLRDNGRGKTARDTHDSPCAFIIGASRCDIAARYEYAFRRVRSENAIAILGSARYCQPMEREAILRVICVIRVICRGSRASA